MAASSVIKSNVQMLMENFDDPDKLQEVINCSEECAALLQYPAATPLSEYCPDHPRRKLDVFCRQCGIELCSDCVSHGHSTHQRTRIATVTGEETWRLGEAADHVICLLEETRRAVSVVKEMRQRVSSRKEHNVERTREAFNALRKLIDEREEHVIAYIKKGADKREKALKLQLERLLLLWTQLQNCLELMKKTRENKVTTTELVRRRKILEQRQDHLMLMKRRSRLEPVVKEQRKVEYKEMEHLCEEVTELGGYPLDPNKCEVTFPTAITIMNKETLLMLTLRDVNGDIVDDSSNEVEIYVTTKTGEAIVVGPVKDVGGGNYTVSFTPKTLGDHMITVVVDGQHIEGSPHKVTVTLRDYSKMSQQDCSVVTDYKGNKFGYLTDVAIGVNDEVVIADWTYKCVIVLDCNMTLLSMFGQGSGDSRLIYPNGVTVSKDGIIAVSDWGSDQVKKYSLQGKLLSVIGNKKGCNNGQLNRPRGLVFSSNKMLYVVDSDNHRIQVFEDNKFAFTFGSKGSNPGQLQKPARIAIDTENVLFVTDLHGNHISLFSHTGTFISRITCDSPWAITVSPDGYIIAGCDGDNNKIRVWSPTHQLIHQFGKKGSQLGEFCGINGIGMNSSGNINVVEWKNMRLQINQ